MRKLLAAHPQSAGMGFLQCGRIYKDAEILEGVIEAVWVAIPLQCGRIYKDAEIKGPQGYSARPWILQCGRIYKDAEMRRMEAPGHKPTATFNVAASIKMRKLNSSCLLGRLECFPSMWPHL